MLGPPLPRRAWRGTSFSVTVRSRGAEPATNHHSSHAPPSKHPRSTATLTHPGTGCFARSGRSDVACTSPPLGVVVVVIAVESLPTLTPCYHRRRDRSPVLGRNRPAQRLASGHRR